MAMEHLSLRVAPEDEVEAIDFYQSLGWKVFSRNEVLSTSEHFDGASSFTYRGITSGTVYTHQETTNYVSLLLERDLALPHREEYLALENRFQGDEEVLSRANAHYQDVLVSNSRRRRGIPMPFIVGGIFLVVGIMITAILSPAGIALIVVGAITVILGIVAAVNVTKETTSPNVAKADKDAIAKANSDIAQIREDIQALNEKVALEQKAQVPSK
jgi:hypothetical protein